MPEPQPSTELALRAVSFCHVVPSSGPNTAWLWHALSCRKAGSQQWGRTSPAIPLQLIACSRAGSKGEWMLQPPNCGRCRPHYPRDSVQFCHVLGGHCKLSALRIRCKFVHFNHVHGGLYSPSCWFGTVKLKVRLYKRAPRPSYFFQPKAAPFPCTTVKIEAACQLVR